MDSAARKQIRANPFLLLLGVFAVLGIIFRFVNLEAIPTGIFVDEQAGIANALCLLRNGTSIYGKPWPIYFQGLGGFYDPIFIYSQAALAAILGASIGTFRILPALCLLSACFGTAALARRFFGREASIIAFLTSLFCPWSFHAGRLVWGSGLITAFIPWGIYFLLRTADAELSAKAAYRSAILSGIFFACAASLYRPANAVVILLLGFIFVLRLPPLNVAFRFILTAGATLVVCGIPNIIFLSGNGWNRVDSLSIFGKEHLAKIDGSYSAALFEVLGNFRKLLSWDFLFVSGDAIYRHTPATGALGWAEGFGLLCLFLFLLIDAVRRRDNFFIRPELVVLSFCAGAVLIGLFPAAQSWDSNPHALRANAAWPFLVLLATAGLTKVFQRFALGPIALCMLFSISIPVFLSHYFFTFPSLGAPWFDTELSRSAKEGSLSDDWSKFASVVKDYGTDGPFVFPMMYENMDCPTAKKFVEELRNPKQKAPPRVTIQFEAPAPLSRDESATAPAREP
jgi:hypothetical protein